MANVLTTVVLEFGFSLAAADYSCQVELDDELNVVDGEVVTSFEPGDDCFFLTKCSSNVRITRIESTWGQINTIGAVSRSRTDDLLFVELNSLENKPSISYEPSGGISPQWIGNTGGALIVDTVEKTVNISSGTIPCYCIATYSVSFISHKLSHSALNLDEYDIHVVVYLEEI